jgi:GNAT superfamily N-acetyltransferase
MIVRKATIADLDKYVNFAEIFHSTTPINNIVKFDQEGYGQFYLSSLQNENIGVWLAEIDNVIVGICGAIAYSLYFNPNSLVVQELWWWLTPESRGSGAGSAMFKQIETWAKERNASALFMIALEDERATKMEKLYVRAGFKPMERTFIKEVKSWL